MLMRFVKISDAVKKALVDRTINKFHLFPEESEFIKIEELLKALDIVRAGTERLQANDINLAVADEVNLIRGVPISTYVLIKTLF